jgi:anaerobic ribonucleoside-triphosphate reductase activating protein
MADSIRFNREQIVWQEVPGEVSLAYAISGCPLRCKGCHSSAERNPAFGKMLPLEYFCARLAQYRGLITCVVFLGGEWLPDQLILLLKAARAERLHTCLYTGLDSVTSAIQAQLTYLKTGAWIAARGGLDSPTTNQRFIDLRTNELLNTKFQHT